MKEPRARGTRDVESRFPGDAPCEEFAGEFTIATRTRLELPADGDRRRPRPLLLAIHGMGMSPEKFARILAPLPQGDLLLGLPRGMYPHEIRRGDGIDIGYSWYIYCGDQEEFHAQLERSEAYLLGLLDEIERRQAIDRQRSVILGFSQGGYLAGFVGCRHPERFGGLVVASARIKHEFLEKELAGGDLPAVFFTHSERDRGPRWADCAPGIEALHGADADVDWFLHDAGHRFPPEAAAAVGRWLTARGFSRAAGASPVDGGSP